MRVLPIEDLFAYFLERRKDFKDAVQGAPEARIEELQVLLPQALPDDYRFFLGATGYGSADMFAAEGKAFSGPSSFSTFPLKYDFTIPTVEKHYRWLLGKRKRTPDIVNQNRFSDRFLFIGTQRYSEDHGSYYLDFGAGGHPPVVNIDEYNKVVPLAGSFKDFIFDYAFSGKSF